MRFLVTNDDGIHAAGLQALITAASELGDVIVVAPATEQSSVGHAITLRAPLRIHQLAKNRYSVIGTPTDCVYIAMHFILDDPPDMVLSGINHGANLGDDVTYSGTVGAAMEGVIQGVPGVAFSLTRGKNFEACIPHIQTLLRTLEQQTWENELLLNVNFPDCSDGINGFHMGALGRRHYGKIVNERTDPRGGHYYWIGGGLVKHRKEPGSDEQIVREGGVAVTPLTIDLTDHHTWQQMKSWPLLKDKS